MAPFLTVHKACEPMTSFSNQGGLSGPLVSGALASPALLHPGVDICIPVQATSRVHPASCSYGHVRI